MINLRIGKKSKTILVHRAVAIAFVSGYSEGMVVNHKDGNKKNNDYKNLEWVTRKENARHAVDVLKKNLGKSNHNAKGICGYSKDNHNLKYSFDSIADAARYFCEDGKNYRYVQTSIYRALNKIRKTYKECVWEYKR